MARAPGVEERTVDPTFDEARRAELRTFLRNRRARLRPEDVGLPHGGPRRRAPGLRREEVAALAGLSVTWYTLFENGRNDRISAEAIAHVAAALKLDADERRYLAALARVSDAGDAAEGVVPSGILAVLDDLGHTPAVVWNRRRDALAWNALFGHVFEYRTDASAWERNGVWRIFLDDDRERRWPDWHAAAERAVAGLKWQFSREPERVHELIAELRRDSAFTKVWEDGTSVHDWMSGSDDAVRVATADGAVFAFRQTTLAPPDAGGVLVQFFTPADDATRDALGGISSSRRP